MPKLRNGETDLEQFTQWLARKCKNHNPLAELVMPALQRNQMPNMYKAQFAGRSARPTIGVVANESRNTVAYRVGNRAFVITVSEVESDVVKNAQLLPVGS